MRLLTLLLSVTLLCALSLPAAAADEAWPPDMEQAFQDFLHPAGPVASDVIYFVPDKAEAADYYSAMLGLPLVWNEEGGGAFLLLGNNVTLTLIDVHEFGPPGWKDGDPLPSPMLAYQIADAAAEAERLREAGAEVRLVHETSYVSVYMATDPQYGNSFSFNQMKDDPMTREIFAQMAASMEE
ncbi:VOC family protein [bacterium]|nr:VOC family protein [bacterium]